MTMTDELPTQIMKRFWAAPPTSRWSRRAAAIVVRRGERWLHEATRAGAIQRGDDLLFTKKAILALMDSGWEMKMKRKKVAA
jgi:hypothetical protein